MTGQTPVRLAVLQRVCHGYRVDLFSSLAAAKNVEMMLFIGDDIPGSKVRNARQLDGIPVTRLRTRFIRMGQRILPLHVGLIDQLRQFAPTVIVCEGESHFLGYLQAIYYRARYARGTALIHWSLVALPGQSRGEFSFRGLIKAFFRKHFDAFVVYSSFGKERLVDCGVDSRNVFVATNVGNVDRWQELSNAVEDTRAGARRRLLLPDQFTVLYVGTLSDNKRPDVVLDLARQCRAERYSFVVLGDGELLEHLKRRASRERLHHVHLLGRVTEQLALYYRAADVLLVPGRGGIVISEAMAFGLPVVVHQADGTEYDLVRHQVTGIVVSSSAVEDFRKALETLRNEPARCAAMGSEGRHVVDQLWTTGHMVRQFLRAVEYARGAGD